MRGIILGVAVFSLGLAAPSLAQMAPPAAAPDLKTFASAADIQALIAKAKADRKGDSPLTVEPILALDSYHVNLEYRPVAGPAALHDTENEIMMVIQGAGTVITGGTMVDPIRLNPANESAPSIRGGTARSFSRGDFLMVPHGTPHQISAVTDTLVLMTVHVPAPAAH